jgi:septal ring factor EnvC (AmiA/AmiB activator)
MCSLRCKILEGEKEEITKDNEKLRYDLDCNQAAIDRLYRRRNDIKEGIKKLEAELKLVDDFIEKNEGVITDIESKINQNSVKTNMIIETLLPLQKEKEKYEFLIKATKQKKR